MSALAVDTYMFVGGYTRKMGHAAGLCKGISIYKFDTKDGNPKYVRTIPESECNHNPTAFYINNDTNYVYACNEYDGQSFLTGLRLDPNNNFEVTQQFTQHSFGYDPCWITADTAQKYIYVANYGGVGKPSVSVYKIDTDSNYLLPLAKDVITERGSNAIPSRQAIPHIHCVMPCANPLQCYVNDLGRDTILHYGIDENDGSMKVLSSLRFRPGDGPRHMAYNPMFEGLLYVSQEMGSAISVIQFDSVTNKLLRVVQTVSSLPNEIVNDAGSVYTTSHIMCDKTGQFLYCANRGHDSIVRFVLDRKNGTLTDAEWFECGGKVPRHFNIDPSNNYLIVANQEGAPFDNICVFRIDHRNNGALVFVQSVQTGTPSYVGFIQKPKNAMLSSKL